MVKQTLPVRGNVSFEELKKVNEHGAEFWSARELQPLLGYSQWRRFDDAVQRAITSCKQSGNDPVYHFAGAGKPITLLFVLVELCSMHCMPLPNRVPCATAQSPGPPG